MCMTDCETEAQQRPGERSSFGGYLAQPGRPIWPFRDGPKDARISPVRVSPIRAETALDPG
jgi:hypothetical protein